uniref:Uncharacterized protein n=1 Tax=Zea mays TaxID=4577 RepID=C0PMH9_MAIZE|nr:unknown [Zea mays]ACN36422.1 unknown [Zea mays]
MQTTRDVTRRRQDGSGGAGDGCGDERRLHLQGELEDLVEANGRRAVRQGPLEGVHEAGNPEAHGGEAQVLAGADATPGAERGQAEVDAADVHVGAALGGQEPLRRERVRVGPHGGIVGYGPHIHHRRGASRDHHAVAEWHVGGGEASPAQQRARRVGAQRLLHNRLQVRHARHVGVGGATSGTDSRVDLGAHPRLHRRVAHQLRHAPLGQKRRRVRTAEDHLLQKQIICMYSMFFSATELCSFFSLPGTTDSPTQNCRTDRYAQLRTEKYAQLNKLGKRSI